MIFVKYGEEEHLRQIQEGYIRFSPIFTYREYEEDAYSKVMNGIADPYDGMARVIPESVTLQTEDEKSTFKGNIILNLDIEGMYKMGIFCMSQYSDLLEMQKYWKEMFVKFPKSTHALLIHDSDVFMAELQKTLPLVAGGSVTYAEEMQPPLTADELWTQALYKRPQYAYQKECRFILPNSQFETPFTYKIDNMARMTLLSKNKIEEYIGVNCTNNL